MLADMVVKVHPSFARTDAEIAPFLPKWQLKAEMNESAVEDAHGVGRRMLAVRD